MNIVIITQARFGSSRLPGKVLMRIGEQSLLEMHLQRLKKVDNANAIIVATTYEPESDMITSVAQNENCLFFKGSTEDVLDRFYNASLLAKPTHIVRVTSDCPLIDPTLVNNVIQFALKNDLAYCFTSDEFPDGVDVEVFKTEELEEAFFKASLLSDREHVTPYIRRKYKTKRSLIEINCTEGNFNSIRFTVDEQRDFEAIKTLIQNLGSDRAWQDYAKFILENNQLFTNQSICRNEGYLKSFKNENKSENN